MSEEDRFTGLRPDEICPTAGATINGLQFVRGTPIMFDYDALSFTQAPAHLTDSELTEVIFYA